MRTYTTRDEAIHREIIEPLGEHAEDFDIDGIADEIIIAGGTAMQPKFYSNPNIDFVAVIENHEK